MIKDKLIRWLDEYSEKSGYMGITRIMKNGETVFEHCNGYGDEALTEPLTPDSVFRFYSITKPFCAIALMQQYEAGKVDLDAHPGKYVPEARGFDPRITVRMVLRHSSGLPEVTTEEFMKRETADIRAGMKALAGQPLDFEPGTGVWYRNTNFALCGLIVEELSGMTVGEYIEKNVFSPLGMKTAFCAAAHPEKKTVTGFDMQDGKRVKAPYMNIASFAGCGDACGTAEDLSRLYLAIREKKLLRPETWDTVFSTPDDNSFGFGCSVFDWHGKRAIQHNGGHYGFRTIQRILPGDDFDIIVLANTGFGTPREDITEKIYELCFDSDGNAANIEMDKGFI